MMRKGATRLVDWEDIVEERSSGKKGTPVNSSIVTLKDYFIILSAT